MGCDIHLFLQIKKGDTWYHGGEIDMWRNYLLFGMLAGVRADKIPKIPAAEAGLPMTLYSEIADRWQECEGDGHSPHFLNIEELLICKELEFSVDCEVGLQEYIAAKQNKGLSVDNLYYYGTKNTEVSLQEAEKYVKLAAFQGQEDLRTMFVKCQVTDKYSHLCDDFWSNIDNIISENPNTHPKDMMLVYWFDN